MLILNVDGTVFTVFDEAETLLSKHGVLVVNRSTFLSFENPQ